MSYKLNAITGTLDLTDTAGATIGLPVIGGTPNSILYVDPSGNLGEDPPYFMYDEVTKIMMINNDDSQLLIRTDTGDFTFVGIPFTAGPLTVDSSSSSSSLNTEWKRSNDSTGVLHLAITSRGTQATPTAVADADQVYALYTAAFDGTDYHPTSIISTIIDAPGGVGSNNTPSAMLFGVTAPSGIFPKEVFRLSPQLSANFSGNIYVGGSTSPFTASIVTPLDDPDIHGIDVGSNLGSGVGVIVISGNAGAGLYQIDLQASTNQMIFTQSSEGGLLRYRLLNDDHTIAQDSIMNLTYRGNTILGYNSDEIPALSSTYTSRLTLYRDGVDLGNGKVFDITIKGFGAVPIVVLARANGATGAPTETLSGDGLGSIQFLGYDDGTSEYVIGPSILGVAEADAASTLIFSGLLFNTIGSFGQETAFQINSEQRSLFGQSSGFTATAARVTMVCSTDIEGLIIQGSGSQSVPLLDLKNSSETTLSQFDYQGKLGIGVTPTVPVQVRGTSIVLENNAQVNLVSRTSDTTQPLISLQRSRSGLGSESVVLNNDILGDLRFQGWNGSNYTNTGALISAIASQNFTGSVNGAELIFKTTPNGASVPLERVRIDNAGFMGVGTDNPISIIHGYVTGAPSTVVVETSVGSGGTAQVAFIRTTQSAYIGLASGNTYDVYSGTIPGGGNCPIVFYAGTGENARIADTVGLQLASGIPLTLGTSSGTRITSSSGVMALKGFGNTNNEDLLFDFETTANQIAVISSTGANLLDFSLGFVFNQAGVDVDCRIEGDTDANLFYTDAGNDRVGIGTASPGSKLDVNGSFQCDSITNDTGLAAGVYTPTRSAEANLDSNVTMSEAQYMRVGSTVTVSGRFTADPTTPATTTSFEITLPVASNIGAAEDAAGVAFCGAIAGQGAAIFGVAANDTAKFQWVAGDVTSQTWSYTFSYQVI